MREFFKVVSLEQARALAVRFGLVGTEAVGLAGAVGRNLAEDITAPADLPGFRRSTMDGFAVVAASTFGASEAAPALLDVVGEVQMGEVATATVGRGQAVAIPTGGMAPDGADAVVMVEHTEHLDDRTIEVSRPVAPGDNLIASDEDAAAGQVLLRAGQRIRAQEAGLLAAIGQVEVEVFRRPVVAILSTGDEIVPPETQPGPGQVRDVNSTTLAALVTQCGGRPLQLGIVPDELESLSSTCLSALAQADTLLISGGSSVGTRDLTLAVLQALPDAELLAHGVAIRPGKPTILSRTGDKAVWGLPGHAASAMVVFRVLVQPFLQHIGGGDQAGGLRVSARLSRNVVSAHGRTDFVRVRVEPGQDSVRAVPVLGRSGLLRTMVGAHGLVRIDRDTEGLDAGAQVSVLLF
ncbi:MAG TPA: gephyrin-like molybdotransferase Glp [Myxococcota bacterium]|nr:gephyrin-like molybdotransferase Glp [Myxococcota bacterium]